VGSASCTCTGQVHRSTKEPKAHSLSKHGYAVLLWAHNNCTARFMRKGWSQAHYHLDTFCTKVTKRRSVVTASFCPKLPLDLRHTALTLGIKATSSSAWGFLTRCKIGAGFSVQPVAGWAWGIRFCRTGSKCSDVGTNILCSFHWWNVLRHSLAAQRWYPRMLVYQSSW